MPDLDKDSSRLPDILTEAAASGPAQTVVTMQIDTDLLAYFEGQGLDLQGQVNGLLRFFVDYSQAKEIEFATEGFESGEMAVAPPEFEMA